MINFTLNNHLLYSINDKVFGERGSNYDKYKVSVGKIDKEYYKKSSWVDEQYRTAETVLSEIGKNPVVMFSGGTDSEIILRVFKRMGVTISPVFIRFIGGYNNQDYEIARAITDSLGYRLHVMDFDVIDFFNSGEASSLAEKIQCKQIAYLSIYHTISKLSQPAIMGGELLLRRSVSNIESPGKWYFCFRENEDASAMRFSLKYDIPLINEWFSYTPEMIGYYLEHPDIKSLITERFNYKLSSISTKNKTLYDFMPDLVKKRKTTGYELLSGFNLHTYRSLSQTHIKRLEPSLDGIFIDDLMVMLHG